MRLTANWQGEKIMKFEDQKQYGQKMLEEQVRRPFVEWFQKVGHIIEKMPDNPEAFGVSVGFKMNLDTDCVNGKFKETYECKAAFLTGLSDVMLDVNNKLNLDSDEFIVNEELDSLTLDPKCKDTEIKDTFWITKVIILFAKNAKIFMQIEETGENGAVSFEESYGGLLEELDGYEGIVPVTFNPNDAITVKFDISFFEN